MEPFRVSRTDRRASLGVIENVGRFREDQRTWQVRL